MVVIDVLGVEGKIWFVIFLDLRQGCLPHLSILNPEVNEGVSLRPQTTQVPEYWLHSSALHGPQPLDS